MFDPSIKKKKKKKKFDLDSALASEAGVDGINEQTLDKENQDPVPDLDEFDGNYYLLFRTVNFSRGNIIKNLAAGLWIY